MLEKEIKFITDFSLEKIKPLGSYFTFDDILNIDIHPSITKYISAELSYLIYEDREKLLSSSIFDYSQPNVIKLLKNVGNELKKFKTISFEDIKNLVLQSVSFNSNFVIRPKWSLVKLVFNEAETKTAEEVILMLDYIYSHEYLRSIIAEYIEKKKILSITKEKFEDIIYKIDSVLIQNDVHSYIDNSLSAMMDFFNIGNKNKINISTDYVEIFLKEKELVEPLLKLKKTFTFGAGAVANVEEIKKVMFSDEISIEEVNEKMIVDDGPNSDNTKEINAVEEKQTDMKDIFDSQTKEPNEKIENINLAESDATVENVHEGFKSVDESVNEIDVINNNEKSEIKEDNVYESDENSLKTEEEVLENKSEISTIENDDELLSLFDEELKALAEDNDIDEDLELSEYNENKSLNEKTTSPDNEITENNEKIEDEKIEDNIEMLGEIEGKIKVDDDNREKIIQTDDIGQEFVGDNFVEGIQDKSVPTEESEFQVDEGFSEEINSVIDSEPEIETVNKHQREKDIFHYLSDKEIDKIVSNVFNEDQEDFAITLEKISECGTLEEANEIIKSVFISYRVNMYTKDASTLTSAISNYFNQ